MFVLAIETCGKTVALVQASSSLMLQGFLSGDEGLHFRNQMECLFCWDGASPFTARLATATEFRDYFLINDDLDSDLTWYLYGEVLDAVRHSGRRDRMAIAA